MEVQQPTILVIAERAGGAQAALQKASIIARHCGATIELFACDVEHGWAVRRQATDPLARGTLESCLAQSARYLDALRGSLPARDLTIATSVACADSLWEGVAARAASLAPLLVVHGLAAEVVHLPSDYLNALDVQRVRQATVPLLLTRGRPWAPAPRIVVAPGYDAPDDSTRTAVMHIARRLYAQCHGWLIEARAEACSGPEALTDLAAQVEADILAVAGPEAASWRAARSSPFESLLGRAACDVLVVPRTAAAAAVNAGLPLAVVALRTNPLPGQS
jgi:hypothetical protein